MSTPAAKRRRLDTVSETLSRPFRSPFKSPSNQASSAKAGGSNDSTPIKPHPAQRPPKPFVTPKARFSSSGVSRRLQSAASLSSAKSPAASASDPEVQSLLKTQRVLERDIAALRGELDTLRQAHKIESSNSDEELRALVRKWKAASRAAAEVVYVDVRDRVNRMGGPSAWRDMQRKRDEWRNTGFDEPPPKNVSSLSEDEKANLYAEYDIDTASEGQQAKDGERIDDSHEKDGEEEDDVFTMDMMLKSLNVELDVIGFDKKMQRWIDD